VDEVTVLFKVSYFQATYKCTGIQRPTNCDSRLITLSTTWKMMGKLLNRKWQIHKWQWKVSWGEQKVQTTYFTVTISFPLQIYSIASTKISTVVELPDK